MPNYHENLMNKILDLAGKVYTTLNAGYDETIYEEALLIEFNNYKLPFIANKKIIVYYDNQKVGEHGLDFIVDERIALELKAKSIIAGSDILQLRNYMENLDLKSGLLINFQSPYNPTGLDTYIISDPISTS